MTAQRFLPGDRHLERAMNKINIRSPQLCGLSKEHAHGTTAAVAQGASRIQRFHRGACGDKKSQACPVALGIGAGLPSAEQTDCRQFNHQWIGHTTISQAIACQQPRSRFQGNHSREMLDPRPVVLDSGVIPHRRVHGNRRQDRTFTGQQHAGQKTVRRALAPTAEAGSTQGSNNDQLSPLSQFDMQRP